MSRTLALFVVSPLLACATASGGTPVDDVPRSGDGVSSPGDVETGDAKGPVLPAGVENRAVCRAPALEGGFVRSEQALIDWLEAAPTEFYGPEEMFGGEHCTLEMIGAVDWGRQQLALVELATNGWVVRYQLDNGTLTVFQEVESQCGGEPGPLVEPGTLVVAVPGSVESLERDVHIEPCIGPPEA